MQTRWALVGILFLAFLAACSDADRVQHDAADSDGGSDLTRDRGQDTLPEATSDATSDMVPDAVSDLARDAQPADSTAAGQEQGADAGEVTCEELGFIGACAGDYVLWCLSDEIFPYDCTNPALAYAGPDRTCGLQDCTSEADGCKGYFCVVKTGMPCNPLAPEEPGLCDAAKDGCLGGVCAPSPACDEATHTPYCDGEFFTYCRYRLQNVDCTVGGTAPYTCGLSSGGEATCLGLAGGGCNLAKGLECVAGLDCLNGVCTEP